MNRSRSPGVAFARLTFVLALVPGCSIPAVYAPRIESGRAPPRTIPSFVVGGTSFREATALLRAAGVSNLAASTGELPSGRGLFRVLVGDRLNRVYFFEGSRFAREVPLRAHPGTDVGLSVKAVAAGGRSAAMVIGAELADEGGTLGIVIVPNDASGESATIPLLRLRPSSGGLRLPLVLGGSLDAGVYFTARDAAGAAWYEAFLIRYRRGGLRVDAPISAQRLLGCSCARDWFFAPERWLSAERRAVDL
jgi:hypothetical protein